MIAPEKVSILADLRDALAAGEALGSLDQCQSVARGFVACNLVLETANLLAALVQSSDQTLAGPVTYRHLRAALTGADPRVVRDLAPLLADEEQTALRGFDPWACVNRWLSVAALAQRVEQSVAPCPRRTAQAIFSELLTCELDASVCKTRARAALDAFQRWWDESLPIVTAIFRKISEELDASVQGVDVPLADLPPRQLRQVLVRGLADSLGAEPITALTSAKNEQLRACVAHQNKGLTYPGGVASGWFSEVYQHLESAEQLRHPWVLNAAEQTRLGAVLAWVQEHGLQEVHDAPLPTLRRLAALPPPVSVGAEATATHPALAEVIHDWNDLAAVVRKRRLPRDWADYPQVSDLFAHPLMWDFRFGEWRQDALAAGLPEGIRS